MVSVAAAARGDEASARSSARADQYRTRCRSLPPSGSRTVSRAYARTSSNSSLYSRDERVLALLGEPVLGERRGLVQVLAGCRAPALDEVPRQQLAARDRLQAHVRQARLEQGEEVAEAVLLAAVRGRRDQDQVPVLVRARGP